MKRFNSQSTDKVKAFNTLKTKLRNCQTEFFKALSSIKDSQPEEIQEEYKFVALVKGSDGKLVLNENNKDVPKIEGGFENKHFQSIKDKLNLIQEDAISVSGAIVNQIRKLQENSFDNPEEILNVKSGFEDLLKKIEEFSNSNVRFYIYIFLNC